MSWGTFSEKCLHCNALRADFEILRYIPEDPYVPRKDIFAVCQNCGHGISGNALITCDHRGNIIEIKEITFFTFQSETLELKHVPSDAEVNFKEGEKSMWNRNYNAAGMVFRKALEMGIKNKFSDPEGPSNSYEMSLKDRINAAKDAGLLTKEMANWAHTIRIIGNDAAHESQFSKEDAEEMQTFTRLMLLYLFTLPGMMKAAQEKKPQNSGNINTLPQTKSKRQNE